MKKSFLLLPAIALSLAACTTTPSSSVEDVVGSATVENANTGWQNNGENLNVSPEYQPEPPVYQPTSQQVTSGFNIPRDVDGKPDYSQIIKGSYTGSTYTVQKGDTLFLLSYLSGQNRETIAQLNNLSYPYTLSVGQVVKLQ